MHRKNKAKHQKKEDIRLRFEMEEINAYWKVTFTKKDGKTFTIGFRKKTTKEKLVSPISKFLEENGCRDLKITYEK